jgi:type IV secretion system protein VirB10
MIESKGPNIVRMNTVPRNIFIGFVGLSVIVGVYTISSRNETARTAVEDSIHLEPATNFSDDLKKNLTYGVIPTKEEENPAETLNVRADDPFETTIRSEHSTGLSNKSSIEEDWREKLKREQDEEFLREEYRRKMQNIQSTNLALTSPIEVDLGRISDRQQKIFENPSLNQNNFSSKMLDLYGTSLKGNMSDPQDGKEAFLRDSKRKPGYLANAVVEQMSPLELKRGSMIPATLITGINSDLPGNITAQVSQNVYDSATGRFLLIPQGSKLLGKYDSRVAYGQRRVLIAWNDIIFPDGATLQLNSMAGTDSLGYSGFKDQVDNHYLHIFGTAILVSLIGTGMDIALPKSPVVSLNNSQSFTQDLSDSARRSFVEGFGRVAERTITKNMDIQPTLEIRPGYLFNVLVDQDIVFPKAYKRGA